MIFHTLGHQDELNAAIGVASEYCMLSNNGLQPMLSEIQSRLFDLGAAVATPVHSSSEAKVAYTKFSPKFTARLEEWIDDLDAKLPPLTNFVIPVCFLLLLCLNIILLYVLVESANTMISYTFMISHFVAQPVWWPKCDAP